MKKLFCDMCGRGIEGESDHATLTLVGGLRTVERDFHLSCSVRLKNKLDSFCAEAMKKEQEESLHARW